MLEFQAIRYIVGDPEFSVYELVNRLTDEGVWADEFLDIIDGTNKAKHGQLFEAALKRLGVEIPERDKAIHDFICLHMHRISKGSILLFAFLPKCMNPLTWQTRRILRFFLENNSRLGSLVLRGP